MQPIFEPHKPRQERKKKGEKGEEEPPDHALGRSRGGLTTKIHLLCDAANPLAVDLLPGNQSESTQAERLLSKVRIPTKQGRPRNRPQYLVADKSYDVSRIRVYLRKRGSRLLSQTRRFPKAENGVREDQGHYMLNAISWSVSLAGSNTADGL